MKYIIKVREYGVLSEQIKDKEEIDLEDCSELRVSWTECVFLCKVCEPRVRDSISLFKNDLSGCECIDFDIVAKKSPKGKITRLNESNKDDIMYAFSKNENKDISFVALGGKKIRKGGVYLIYESFTY